MSSLKRRPDDSPDTDEEQDGTIDPELRLRTVRTAASVIAESIRSEQRAERRKLRSTSRFFRSRSDKKKRQTPSLASSDGRKPTTVVGKRRNIYINYPLPVLEVDSQGEPLVRYPRNKVRTTKYTPLTFVPKNLYEQFRRVANIYFFMLVVVQVFPVFGAPNARIAALPLLFILTVTAIKDGIEDYRRGQVDEEVNTSPATKLGHWRNVNQPTDPRTFFEKLFRINAPGKVSKGVRKLREKDAREGRQIVLNTRGDSMSTNDMSMSSSDLRPSSRSLDDIQSIDSHRYPPMSQSDASKSSIDSVPQPTKPSNEWGQFGSVASEPASFRSQNSIGVINGQRHITGSPRWERTLWKKLEVGDVVLLRDNEQVPADIVVLSTSDPDGMCYVETKNLDGETNLKPRKAVKATSSIRSEEDIERSAFYLDSEPPHQNLYLYHGVLRYKDPATGDDKQETVGINEFLLRGCALRNTTWVIGLVVFTGADTKIMLNGGDTPSKQSKIEKETNFNVIVNFVFLIVMCLVAAIFNGLADGRVGDSRDVFEPGSGSSSSVLQAVITFVSCLIAFQNIVPISLYISIEIVKTIQAYFISQDLDMYYGVYDTPCLPKTWNISDDLGQIEYIFSDKTGTLTQNIMEFQQCSIGGVIYGEGVTEAQRGSATREGRTDMLNNDELQIKLDALKREMLANMERTFKNRYCQPDKLTLIAPKLADDLADRSSEQRQRLIAFFRALALCHSVLSEKIEPQAQPFLLEYKAESPDEAAIVAAARDVGFPFVAKTKDGLDIEVMGQIERYVHLRTLEFNSTRKRMSVIVRAPDGKIILYCKGADTVIYERLAKDHDPVLKDQTHKDMETFANNGLRTLCIAYRYVEENEYFDWSRTYDAATAAVENRDEEISRANELMEHSLTVLGATALEDKLQEGVPDAIELLHRAGIKLWILTGDKLQTAIEIGYSCNLLKNDMDVMILSAGSLAETRTKIEAGLNKIASVLGPPSWDPRKRGFVVGAQASFAIVIDGDTLTHALTDELKPLFLTLGTQCETVVCCRVSPAQKALTVKLVKEGRKAMTLSIGDGANDVAMIQEANIGCGLLGLEGSQAAMSADYAFGQFRFLTKLLLVHGRWSYQRIADMHANFFYKNVIWTLAMFWFLPFNDFDATYLYQYTFILLYNLIFTSLPVMVLGAFDQDINSKAALAFPQLYVRGIRGLEYTRGKFWLHMLDGLYQSAVVFFIPYLAWTLGLAVSWNGLGIDSLSDFGTTVAVSAIFAANTYVGMNTHYWTIITWIVVFGSSVVMLIWIVIYSFFQSSDFVNEVLILYGGLKFWSTVVFTVATCLTPRFVVKFISTVYFPLDKDIVREMWVKGDLKDRLGIRHRKAKRNGKKEESTPMFHEPHNRSRSDVDNADHTYEPVQLSDRPPIDHDTHLPGSTPPSEPFGGQLLSTNNLTLAVPNLGERFDHKTELRASYYSASDIPLPSPMPTPVYRYSSGETTTTPPSRSLEIARRISSASRNAPPSIVHTSPPLPPRSPPILSLPPARPSNDRSGRTLGVSTPPNAYEMRVRAPSPYSHQASVSQASFTTGQEDFWSAEEGDQEDDDVTVEAHPQPRSGLTPEASPALPTPRLGDELNVAHDRHVSQGSWHGGMAI